MRIAPFQRQFTDELLMVLRCQPYRDPLLPAIRSGQMSRCGVKNWALQASFIVRDFVPILQAIQSNCPYPEVRELLAENIREEQGCGITGEDHFSLIKRLAGSLGATDEETAQTDPLPETADYRAFCRRMAQENSFIESLTAIGVGIEFFVPKFFDALAKALKQRFDLSDKDLAYLQVHVSADEDHSRRSLEIIDCYANSTQIQDGVRQTLSNLLAVKHRFANAVYAHCIQAN